MELYESIMWKYISEEKDILQANLERNDIAVLASRLTGYQTVYFVSHGSSYNASMTVAPFFMKYAGINAICVTAGNFISCEDRVSLLDKQKTLIVLISQTGNSRGTLEGALMARRHGIDTLGLSANDSATLKGSTDFFLTLNCGEEDSNAKTKGMSSTILVLLLLAMEISVLKNRITQETKKAMMKELYQQCEELEAVHKLTTDFCDKTSFGKDMENFYIIGTDMNYGLALEAQIKVMETMCIPTCAVDSEEFSHGTHRSINEKTSLLIIRTPQNADMAQKTYDYFNMIARVSMIETFDDNRRDNVVNIPCHPLTQSVLTIVEFIQIISAYAPEYNHLDPNRDANNEFTELAETRI